MRKVLLVTIQNSFNFGNRLQNYALYKELLNLGCTVDNLILHDINISTLQKIKNTIRKILVCFGVKKYLAGASIWARTERCVNFSQKYIHKFLYIRREKLNTYNFNMYDVAVTGSDQVWHNWNRIHDELSYYYLGFIDKERRVAYAPSFGFPEFPKDDIEAHRKGLMGMKTLSCREKEGCDLIYKLTGRTAQKVLDPTLLLSAEEWQVIEEEPKFDLPPKYLLLFMLGSISDEYQQEINDIANQRKIKVITINNLKNPAYYGISPAEFIWLIHHADTVCTDSFHASVFSIIFERNLRVFKRISPKLGNMFGRLHDLLQPLRLYHLVYGIGKTTDLSTKLEQNARRYLEEEKEKSVQYLTNSIEICRMK